MLCWVPSSGPGWSPEAGSHRFRWLCQSFDWVVEAARYIYMHAPVQILDKSSVHYESFTISSLNFTNWLDSVVKAVRYMHASGSNPEQVLKHFASPVIHRSCKIFYYLSLMSRTPFYHQLDFTVVKATRYMHVWVQIPEKSVPCDCLLPFLALTSITDLTQWLRLQEICTPRVQIPDKSSLALCLAFLFMPRVQIPGKWLIANSFLPIFCNMGAITDQYYLATSLFFAPPIQLGFIAKRVSQ